MRTVVALKDEALDAIAYREYGRHGLEAIVLSENGHLAGKVTLEAGDLVRLPEVPSTPPVSRIRLWS